MTSTSVHCLNADRRLNRPQQCLWLGLNWLNNSFFPNAGGRHLAIRNFGADTTEERWRRTDVKSSPSRKLSDLFWLQLQWESVQSELEQINVLDVGCGSGEYSVKLQSCSGNKIASYTGFDAFEHRNWVTLAGAHPWLSFRKLDSVDILPHIPERTNLFVTQSAIEHFEHDLAFFEQIRRFCSRASRSVIQVHLFPSSACLKLYLLHGVRQYTPRTISMIARLFQEFSYCILYKLGGGESNRLHWRFITKPLFVRKMGDLRESRTEEYDSLLRRAIEADNKSADRDPSFYALVIHSNWEKAIFQQ